MTLHSGALEAISLRVSSSGSGGWDARMIEEAPARAKEMEIVRPMPVPPPVIRTDLPVATPFSPSRGSMKG